jgi:signal transduction histidine kinase
MDDHTDFRPSHVKEVGIIQASLKTLQSRLKIKQISRKRVVDEFVHQTRTPLTILRTHLEGLEDGVITHVRRGDPGLSAQIDNLSSLFPT